MDALWWLHLTFIVFFLSIPFWPLRYLRYGVWAPLALATVWILFTGCPLTFLDPALNDEYFSRILLQYVKPDISKEATARVSYYILLVVTVIGFLRLCPKLL